ncbi:DUF7242 family protein [Streptomyces sp. CoH17]|uniref:DUF7242 family protein n=1 Tax=Streptomyces sp. CoH17 TaxID=2992806 RepID=UPI002271719E|nr:hypothetical protein [Streptomyces sp. CoH17]
MADSMLDTVSTTDHAQAIREYAKNHGMTLKDLMSEVEEAADQEAGRPKKESKADRVARWRNELSEMPEEQVQDLDRRMQTFVSEQMPKVPKLTEPRELSQEEWDRMGEVIESLEKIDEALKGVYGLIRMATNMHLNAKYADADARVRPPEQLPGKIVASNGRKFCREGGNRTATQVNWKNFREKVPEELYHEACDRKWVPPTEGHWEYTPTKEKLEKLIEEQKVDLELVRSVLIPGKWQKPKFQVR